MRCSLCRRRCQLATRWNCTGCLTNGSWRRWRCCWATWICVFDKCLTVRLLAILRRRHPALCSTWDRIQCCIECIAMQCRFDRRCFHSESVWIISSSGLMIVITKARRFETHLVRFSLTHVRSVLQIFNGICMLQVGRVGLILALYELNELQGFVVKFLFSKHNRNYFLSRVSQLKSQQNTFSTVVLASVTV